MSNSFATPWAIAHQASLSMGFLRREYWSGLLFPSPGDLPDPGIELSSPALAGRWILYHFIRPPGKPLYMCVCIYTHTAYVLYIYIYMYSIYYTYSKTKKHIKNSLMFLPPRGNYY